MEDALAQDTFQLGATTLVVLILVVMEDALALLGLSSLNGYETEGLNPCCNGRCTRTDLSKSSNCSFFSLNPCCNGRCTRTFEETMKYAPYKVGS